MSSIASFNLDAVLDVFGQQPGLYKLYTQISFVFSSSTNVQDEEIRTTLAKGLHKLTEALPWTTGRVVKDEAAEGGNRYSIRVRETAIDEPAPVLRDYRHDTAKAFKALRQRGWPMSALDESWLCPRNTLVTTKEESNADVFMVQASFIEGGIVVSFVGQHNVVDMTGLVVLIELFDKACNDLPLTDRDLPEGCSLIHERVPRFDERWKPDADARRYMIRTDTTTTTAEGIVEDVSTNSSPLPACWAYFQFSSEALSKLKAKAMEGKPNAIAYITTDDALSAFVWQSTCRARDARMPSGWSSTLGRAVDARTFIGMSPRFPGLVQNMTYHDSSYEKLSGDSLGKIASGLREAVDPETSRLSETTRAIATLLARAEDKNTVSVIAPLDLSKDIALSSWSKFDLCNLTFGLGLGPAEIVRRPQFTPVPGLMNFMPKDRDGSIALAISLAGDDLQRLKSDERFREYADYIG